MNFNHFSKNLFFRCIGIIISPKVEWIKIKDEDVSFFKLITDFLLPLLLIVVVVSIIGGYIKIAGNVFSWNMLIVSGLKPFLSLLISILVGIPAINAMIKTFGGTPKVILASKLVVYSYLPGILVVLVIGIAPQFFITGLFFLYSFYIIFHGTPVLLNIPFERQSNFSTLSSTTILIIFLIISFVISSMFEAIQ